MPEILDVKYFPSGTMNLDDDLHYLNKGDYGKAVGIRSISNAGEGSVSVEDVLGNKFAFQLPVIADGAFKTYRVIIQSDVSRTYAYKFRKTDNSVFLTTGSYPNTVGNINQSLSDVAQSIQTYVTSQGYTVIINATVTGTDSGTLDITFSSLIGYEWYLEGNSADAGTPVILTESLDTSMAGPLEVIGSREIGDVVFIFSTNESNLPQTFSNVIANISNNGTGEIRVQTTTAHGLIEGQSIYIFGTPLNSNANGTWLVRFVNATTFDLYYSNFSGVITSGGSFIVRSQSVSEIGVAFKNQSNDVWSYITLFRTKQWGFRKKKQIDVDLQYENDRYSLYYCDDYNPDRVFYYDGPFSSFGAFRLFNSRGLYDFETVYNETVQEINSQSATMETPEVLDTDGAFKAGNTRFVFRFITESGVFTPWSELSNPVNIYKDPASVFNYVAYQGNDDNTVTSKSVRLTFSNIPLGVYQFIQVGYVRYTANAYEGFIVAKYLLAGTSITVTLRNNESTLEDLDVATLATLQSGYVSSKNIRLVDQRLLKSNLTSNIIPDLSPFFGSWTHELFKKELDSIPIPTTDPRSNINDGEYFRESETYEFVGYMQDDTYRFEARVQLLNGSWIQTTFFIDDICFDTNPVNTGNGTDNRRTGTFADYSLFDASLNKRYVPAVRFSFDLDFVVNGTPVKNIIRRILITRVEMTEQYQEILATGYLMPLIGNPFQRLPNPATAPDHNAADPIVVGPVGGTTPYYEYMGFKMREMLSIPSTYETFTVPWNGNNVQQHAAYAAFYSPDIFLGKKVINLTAGDVMLQYDDQPDSYESFVGTYGINGGVAMESHFRLLNCLNAGTFLEKRIGEMQTVAKGGTATFNSGADDVSKKLLIQWSNITTDPFTWIYNEYWHIAESPVLKTDSGIFSSQDGASGSGWIYSAYKKDLGKGDKFGLPGISKSVPTGASVFISPMQSGIGVIEVFGGDAFTQRTYFKYRYPERINTQPYVDNGGCNLGTPHDYFCRNGFGEGMVLYSQNRINSQMRYNPDPNTISMFPDTGSTEGWLERNQLDPDIYQHGFDIRTEINRYAEFNTLSRTVYRFPTRFIYSEIMAIGSLTDNLRTFLPANIYDLPIKDGPVNHHEICNGEVIAFQDENFVRLYFNSNTLIQSTDGSDVIIGSGQVIRNKPQNLSSFGSRHKWGVLKGKSDTGHDVIYWMNAKNGRVFRFGGDGTSNITLVKKMRTFFKAGLKWVINKDTPADGNGICVAWDSRNYEAIFTVRATRDVGTASIGAFVIWEKHYSTHVPFNPGNVVMLQDYTGVTLSTFEQRPDLYKCKVNHIPDFFNRPGTGVNFLDFWEVISHDDLNYFNEYTIVFSEVKNGWSCFLPDKPKIYIQAGDSYLSPRPVENVNKVYEHNEGELLTWYRDTAAASSLIEQAIDGEIEMPVNYDPNMNKGYQAMMINSLIVPFKVTLRTNDQVSYLDQNDFEDRRKQFVSNIKNNASVTSSNPSGLNTTDADPMYGTWMMVKFCFQNRVYQRLVDFVSRVVIRERTYKK